MKINKLFLLLVLAAPIRLFAQDAKFLRIDTIKGPLYRVEVKKCPGRIFGSCWRPIWIATPFVPQRPRFKNAIYQIQNEDKIYIVSPLEYIKLLYESDLVEKAKAYGEAALWNDLSDLADGLTIVKEKVFRVNKFSLDGYKAIVMDVKKEILKSILGNSIAIKTHSEIVQIRIILKKDSNFFKYLIQGNESK